MTYTLSFEFRGQKKALVWLISKISLLVLDVYSIQPPQYIEKAEGAIKIDLIGILSYSDFQKNKVSEKSHGDALTSIILNWKLSVCFLW